MRYFLSRALMALALLAGGSALAAPADVRILIDGSGSMHASDPASLRAEAMALLVQLLPPGSRAGVWRFAEQVEEVVPYGAVDDAFKARAQAEAVALSAAGSFTDIEAALAAATVQAGDGGAHIILLTDGQMDIARDPALNGAARARLLEQRLPDLVAAGFKVHTIALGSGADRELLLALALATGGRAAEAATAQTLTEAFVTALESAEPTQGVPLLDGAFAIDSSVEEFTVLALAPEVPQALLDPTGRAYAPGAAEPQLRWQREARFDLITVRQPIEGRWQLRGAAGARVRLLTDLRLVVQGLEPNANLAEPLPVAAALVNGRERIIDPALLALTRLQIKGTDADGNPWSTSLNADAEGLFQTQLPPHPAGEHLFELRLEGPTFVREQQRRVTVRPPFEALLEEAPDDSGGWLPTLRVRALSARISRDATQVVVSVLDPAGRRQVRPVRWAAAGDWQWPLQLGRAGSYLLAVSVSGRAADGVEFHYELPPLPYHHDPSQALGRTAAPPAVAMPDPEPQSKPEPVPVPEPLPPPAEPAPQWPWWLLGGGLAAALAGGALWCWRRGLLPPRVEPSAAENAALGLDAEAESESMPQSMSQSMPQSEPAPVMAMPEPPLFDADPGLELPPLQPLEDGLSEPLTMGEPPPVHPAVSEAELDDAISSLIDELDGKR